MRLLAAPPLLNPYNQQNMNLNPASNYLLIGILHSNLLTYHQSKVSKLSSRNPGDCKLVICDSDDKLTEETTEILLYKLQATARCKENDEDIDDSKDSEAYRDKTQVKKVLQRELEDGDFSMDNFMNNDRELRKKGEDRGYRVGEKSRMKVEDGRERAESGFFGIIFWEEIEANMKLVMGLITVNCEAPTDMPLIC
ncbi:unnamed protein product [Vicia faba]|uniref:Uncharacterized protein n=1 Tax=Vicia faba TaxID=3906 RepID=A0AAV0YJ53_VICFA|nr:unnamed protein product [Vicia faba]